MVKIDTNLESLLYALDNRLNGPGMENVLSFEAQRKFIEEVYNKLEEYHMLQYMIQKSVPLDLDKIDAALCRQIMRTYMDSSVNIALTREQAITVCNIVGKYKELVEFASAENSGSDA